MTGAWPSASVMSAPIARSGSATRAIGRPESEASPVRTDSNGCPAKTPISSRIVVPELPQSSGPRRRAERPAVDDEPALARHRLDLDAERAQTRERGLRVGGVGEADDLGAARRERGEDRRAVRERLVGRERDGPGESKGGRDGNGHGRGKATGHVSGGGAVVARSSQSRLRASTSVAAAPVPRR